MVSNYFANISIAFLRKGISKQPPDAPLIESSVRYLTKTTSYDEHTAKLRMLLPQNPFS